MIRTRFGVIIPPWRKPDRGECVTLEFVLTGKIPSKKNRQRASFNYSWAISQVRQYFKTQDKHTITAAGTLRFVVKLIRDIRPFIYKPPEITEWETAAKQQITYQANEWRRIFASKGLCYPLCVAQVSIKHYWADEYQRDNSNREQTIHDILVEAGILADDNYKCLFRNVSEAQCYKDEILDHITLIHITAYRW